MNGIELSIAGVVRIENEIDKAIRVASLGGQFVKYAELAMVPLKFK